MNTQNDVDKQIDKFQLMVGKHFNFLSNDFGFVKEDIKRLDFDFPQDKKVEIGFLGIQLWIIVRWFLSYANIEVGLVKLTKGRKPEKVSFYGDPGYACGISLADLVEVVSKGRFKNPLPQSVLGETNAEIKRKWMERDNLIANSMDSIVATYASMLNDYGAMVLKGDFAMFPEIQKYSRRMIRG